MALLIDNFLVVKWWLYTNELHNDRIAKVGFESIF